MSKHACMAFSWLIYSIRLRDDLLHDKGGEKSENRRGDGSRAGFGSQTKGETTRCEDGASAFTPAGGHYKGGDRKVGG